MGQFQHGLAALEWYPQLVFLPPDHCKLFYTFPTIPSVVVGHRHPAASQSWAHSTKHSIPGAPCRYMSLPPTIEALHLPFSPLTPFPFRAAPPFLFPYGHSSAMCLMLPQVRQCLIACGCLSALQIGSAFTLYLSLACLYLYICQLPCLCGCL